MATEMMKSTFVDDKGTLGSAQKIGGVTPEAIQRAVADWLEDHPEATTTVQDGAISNAKLDAKLQAAVGITTAEGELFTDEDWVDGYLGTAHVNSSNTNGDKRVKRAARVYAGETVHVKLALPLAESYSYLYYAYVAGENDLTYVSERFAGVSNSKYNDSDENYRYYEQDIEVESDGWLIVSYRPRGLAYSISNFLGTVETNRLNELTDAVTVQGAAISALQLDAAADMSHRFPSDEQLPICSAHRAMARSGLPENTLPALRACKVDGWTWVETDARLTSDEVWVCLHDASINSVAKNADGTDISGTVNVADIRITDESHVLACQQSVDDTCRSTMLVEFMVRHQLIADVEMLQKDTRGTGVLCQHEVNLF